MTLLGLPSFLGPWLAMALLLAPTPARASASEGLAVRLVSADALSVGPIPAAWREAWEARPPGPELLARSLEVRVQGARVAMLGKVAIEGDDLVFRPRFPFRPGLNHEVEFRPGALGIAGAPDLHDGFHLPESSPAEPAKVAAVYPSGDELPENVLRFYVHFSAPMARGEAYSHLQLLDSEGTPIDRPFLELGEELWDPSGTRFTLLLDPGRIKRGLVPHQELGPILVAGGRYTLEILPGWAASTGRPMAEGFRKAFRAIEEDTIPPEPSMWKIRVPNPRTVEPLTCLFPEPMDRALASRLLQVLDQSGRAVAGFAEVGDQERSWTFTPARPWPAGEYFLRVDTDLEDRAGNRVGQRFEVDVFEKVEEKALPRFVEIPLRIE